MAVNLLKRTSDFLARVPGLPLIVGAGLAAVNFALGLLPGWPVVGWLAQTDLLLHAGVVLGLLGVLLGDAL
jgi:hypothetical protein